MNIIDDFYENFLWGVRPIIQWLSEKSSLMARILKPLMVTKIESEEEITVIDAEAVPKLDAKVQRALGQLQAQVELLKQDKEILIRKIYEDKVMNIGKELTTQLSTIAQQILTKGDLTFYKELPTAISAGREGRAMGILFAVSRYQDRHYPILLRLDPEQSLGVRLDVITQGVSSQGQVVKNITYDKAGNALAFLSYDANGRFLPTNYVRAS
jgi:hypothetical protein